MNVRPSIKYFAVHYLMLAVSVFPGIQLSGTTIPVNRKQVVGVAWLEGKIYVITNESNTVHVYPDHPSLDRSKHGTILLKGMKNPRDMVASKLSRSIFISDQDNRCLWKIQMPGREISRWDIDGISHNMSVSSSEILVLCVLNRRYSLTLNRPSNVMFMESIPLPTEVDVMKHAVQLLNNNFLIFHSMEVDPDSYLISELSADGNTFIRSFDPRSTGLNQVGYWTSLYMSIDEDENIFISDPGNDRILLLNSRLTDVQILLSRDQHSIKEPVILCYVREKHQLIVCQGRVKGSTHEVRVYNLHTRPRPPTDYQALIKSGSVDPNFMNAERFDNLTTGIPGEKILFSI